MALAIILFFIGLIALWGGAKWLVQGASRLAANYGIPSLLIGLTIVAWGTSAPEILVTLVGAWKGEGELIIGNLVGSNIFNILLVLGLCAALTPLVVNRQLIRWDVPIMVVSALLFWWLASGKKIGRVEGILLLGGLTLYLIFTYLMVKKHPADDELTLRNQWSNGSASELRSERGSVSGLEESIANGYGRRERLSLIEVQRASMDQWLRKMSDEPPPPFHPLWKQLISILLGLILLAVGSELVITNATKIARYLGINELLIGLTIVAVGTSLPELVTTLVALRKKENDIAVGHIVGSNIFNLLGAMGISALLSPIPIAVPQKALTFDIPIMVAVSIGALPIFLTGHRISRWEGILFLFYYALYLLFLFNYISYFTSALIFFIIPFTILTLFLGVVRHFRPM